MKLLSDRTSVHCGQITQNQWVEQLTHQLSHEWTLCRAYTCPHNLSALCTHQHWHPGCTQSQVVQILDTQTNDNSWVSNTYFTLWIGKRKHKMYYFLNRPPQNTLQLNKIKIEVYDISFIQYPFVHVAIYFTGSTPYIPRGFITQIFVLESDIKIHNHFSFLA